jgi:hypothetical protein
MVKPRFQSQTGGGASIERSEWIRAWSTVAVNSFGGPAGQVAVMHDEIVVRRRWVGERRFLHALNYCMLLPGPEAQQLATYLGWLLRGVRGGDLPRSSVEGAPGVAPASARTTTSGSSTASSASKSPLQEAARNTSTTFRWRPGSVSGTAAAPRTRRRARLASFRAATGVRPTIGAIWS